MPSSVEEAAEVPVSVRPGQDSFCIPVTLKVWRFIGEKKPLYESNLSIQTTSADDFKSLLWEEVRKHIAEQRVIVQVKTGVESIRFAPQGALKRMSDFAIICRYHKAIDFSSTTTQDLQRWSIDLCARGVLKLKVFKYGKALSNRTLFRRANATLGLIRTLEIVEDELPSSATDESSSSKDAAVVEDVEKEKLPAKAIDEPSSSTDDQTMEDYVLKVEPFERVSEEPSVLFKETTTEAAIKVEPPPVVLPIFSIINGSDAPFVQTLALRLKEMHSDSFPATDDAYSVWAQWILTLPKEDQDPFTCMGPPNHLSGLFSPALLLSEANLILLTDILRANDTALISAKTATSQLEFANMQLNSIVTAIKDQRDQLSRLP